MKLEKIIYSIITILLIIGLYGSGELVWDEIQTGNGCPKIWLIPVCAIVMVCFLIPLIVHLLKKYNTMYFVYTGLAFLIAIIASVMQFNGLGECPKLDNGTPMCYLSLLLFSILIALKMLLIKTSKNHQL
ncbi:hypothetical protein [Psychroserpens luteus]|uniref:Uncharacterized protein n=1 Tax=Psychroserpens luteus TaxID=1434066 RepID=A0ABW5ZW74_9FLAO|nr:hypothetical protein [Psychroserpens luteus]